jgi:hypothetical protein
MKKIAATFFSLTLFIAALAQAPQSFKYQSVARNGSGNPVASANIGVRISIHDLNATGTVVYKETHTAATNAFGTFTLSVGGGAVVSGIFSTIAWGSGSKFIEVEADFAGGTSYTSMGASQLLSVPYALYSANGGTPGPQGIAGPQGPAGLLIAGTSAGNTPYWNGTTWVVNNSNIFNNGGNVGIGTSAPSAKLDIAGTLKVADGTQGVGKVLTSDANGLASWASYNSWGLTGNSGTVAGTNFIGTTDTPQLNFRVAGLKAGLIDGAGENTFLGVQSGNNSPGMDNTAIGYETFYSNVEGIFNTAIGGRALYSNTAGIANTANGYQSLYSNTTGNDNIATGSRALYSNTTGYSNIAYGVDALHSNTVGYINFCFGQNSLYSNVSGVGNTAIGGGSLYSNTTGSANTALGLNAFKSGATFENSTAIGYDTQVTASNMMVFGNGVTKWGFGVSPAAGNAFQVGTNGTNGSGAYLTNGGVWTNTSDRNKKENFHTVNGKEILAQIAQLPITRWNYKGEAASIQHIGPMAQDFYKLFQVGNNETSISTIDPSGIALAAIQELNKQKQEQQQIIENLKTEIKQLKEQVLTSVGKQDKEMTALKKQMEEVLRIVGAEAKKK